MRPILHICALRRPPLPLFFAGSLIAASAFIVQRTAIAGPVEDIERAWQHRQSLVENARFVWLTTRTDTKGAYTSAVHRVDPEAGDFPPQDTTYTVREEIVFDKTRGRLIKSGKLWDFSNKKLVQRDEIRVLGGDSLATLSDGIEGVRGKQGALYPREHPFAGLTEQPVIYCLRPFVTTLGGLRAGSFRLQGTTEVDGKKVVVLLDQRGMKCHLDPRRDYILIRLTGERPSGEPRFQLDIDYDREQLVGWLPKEWRLIEYGEQGDARIAMSCEVVERAINGEVPDELFTITFPEGTRVFDQIKGINYVVEGAAAPGNRSRSD